MTTINEVLLANRVCVEKILEVAFERIDNLGYELIYQDQNHYGGTDDVELCRDNIEIRPK